MLWDVESLPMSWKSFGKFKLHSSRQDGAKSLHCWKTINHHLVVSGFFEFIQKKSSGKYLRIHVVTCKRYHTVGFLERWVVYKMSHSTLCLTHELCNTLLNLITFHCYCQILNVNRKNVLMWILIRRYFFKKTNNEQRCRDGWQLIMWMTPIFSGSTGELTS